MDSLKIADLHRDIVGAERGIIANTDVLTRTVDGHNLNLIWNEFQASLDQWNAGRSTLAGLFSFPTTNLFDLVALDGDRVEFELASEFGAPKSSRVSPGHYRMGFPFDWHDIATRFTWKFMRNATREQIESQHHAVLEGDNHMVFNAVLGTVTTPYLEGSRPTTEEGHSVYSLYAGSADDAPPAYAGRTFASGHNHYLVSGAANIDGGDLYALTEHIQHHGWGVRGSRERVVIMVHPTEGRRIRTFRRDPEDNPDAPVNPYDFIPSDASAAYLSAENIMGEKPPAEFQGLDIIGSYGDALIYESYFIPEHYALAVATAGANSTRNPVAFRQHTSAESQGLLLLPGTSPNHPLPESWYTRGFGTGIRHRGAAAVMQIKASGSYQDPIWT